MDLCWSPRRSGVWSTWPGYRAWTPDTCPSQVLGFAAAVALLRGTDGRAVETFLSCEQTPPGLDRGNPNVPRAARPDSRTACESTGLTSDHTLRCGTSFLQEMSALAAVAGSACERPQRLCCLRSCPEVSNKIYGVTALIVLKRSGCFGSHQPLGHVSPTFLRVKLTGAEERSWEFFQRGRYSVSVFF